MSRKIGMSEMTRMLKALEEQGEVVRFRDPDSGEMYYASAKLAREQREKDARKPEKSSQDDKAKLDAELCKTVAGQLGLPIIVIVGHIDEHGLYDLRDALKSRKYEGKNKQNVLVILTSESGKADVAYQMIEMIKTHFDQMELFVPYDATGAAVLFLLAADHIKATGISRFGQLFDSFDTAGVEKVIALGTAIARDYGKTLLERYADSDDCDPTKVLDTLTNRFSSPDYLLNSRDLLDLGFNVTLAPFELKKSSLEKLADSVDGENKVLFAEP